jgi:hypothetical protein
LVLREVTVLAIANIRPQRAQTSRLLRAALGGERECLRLTRVPTADHHIQHVYVKIGVSTRAAAALWAIQNAVVP